jgi:hypothetical protein
MDTKKTLCAALSAISDVEIGRSRFGSRSNPAWRIAGREFAHLHSASLVDLRVPRTLQAKLRSDSRAHFRTGKSEWVELEFHSQTDVAAIAALAEEAAAAARAKRK